MTADDDAFIRTIVDNPGHDLPRLVYADWLDDRDDPRGPFLRAEVEWAQPWKEGVRPGDATELRAMAEELDPLWVARVSRPPMGVCADHVFFQPNPQFLTDADVTAFERRIGYVLPAQYRGFLLNRNGGEFYPKQTAIGSYLEPFFPLSELPKITASVTGIRESWGEPPPGTDEPEPDAPLLCVSGTNSAGLLLQLAGERVGRLLLHFPDSPDTPVEADSLGELFASLCPDGPGWVLLAVAGRTEELLSALDAGPGLNAIDGLWSPLDCAVQWGRADTVRALLARDASLARRYPRGASDATPEVRAALAETAWWK